MAWPEECIQRTQNKCCKELILSSTRTLFLDQVKHLGQSIGQSMCAYAAQDDEVMAAIGA